MDAGNRLAQFALRCMKACRASGTPCTLEQPASSWMLRLPPFSSRSRSDGGQNGDKVSLDYFKFRRPLPAPQAFTVSIITQLPLRHTT